MDYVIAALILLIGGVIGLWLITRGKGRHRSK